MVLRDNNMGPELAPIARLRESQRQRQGRPPLERNLIQLEYTGEVC